MAKKNPKTIECGPFTWEKRKANKGEADSYVLYIGNDAVGSLLDCGEYRLTDYGKLNADGSGIFHNWEITRNGCGIGYGRGASPQGASEQNADRLYGDIRSEFHRRREAGYERLALVAGGYQTLVEWKKSKAK